MGVSLIALISVTSLSSCAAFEALPDEERYKSINKVLSDIDYQNIGEVTFEEKDNGDGVFAPSYKRIKYNNTEVFDKIAKKLAEPEDSNINETCEYFENSTTMNCTYYGNSVSLGRLDGETTIIKVSDSQGGRGLK